MDKQTAVFEAPIRINYIPPRWLSYYTLITCLGALVCLVSIDPGWMIKALLLAFVLLGLGQGDFSQLERRLLRVVLDGKDRWFIIEGESNSVAARLVKASIPLPEFIVLILQTADGRRFKFFLTTDNLDRTSLRRLRIRLYHPKAGTHVYL